MIEINQLHKWPNLLKQFTAIFLLVLIIGVTLGLVYVGHNTNFIPLGTAEHYRGSEQLEEFDIPEKFPLPFESMLLTTHVHVIALSLIFFVLGCLLYLSDTVSTSWKKFLIIEPLVSVVMTFGSIWGIRYVHSIFGYITVFSGILMYASFYIISFILIYDLVFKK